MKGRGAKRGVRKAKEEITERSKRGRRSRGGENENRLECMRSIGGGQLLCADQHPPKAESLS